MLYLPPDIYKISGRFLIVRACILLRQKNIVFNITATMRIPLKYETPAVKVIEIRVESFICQSGSAGGNLGDLGGGGEDDEIG